MRGRTPTAADGAVAAVGWDRPPRVDVWGHLHAPMRTLAHVVEWSGDPPLELGHGCDLPSVATALLHGDIDAAFGRVHPPLPGGPKHRLVRLDPVDVVLGEDRPLAADPGGRRRCGWSDAVDQEPSVGGALAGQAAAVVGLDP